MLFLLDANVLITAHNTYYPIDSVPEFWDWLRFQGEQGIIKMPIETYEEIKDGSTDKTTDLLFAWISNADVRDAILLEEEVQQSKVAYVVENGYADDLNDFEIEQIGRDPFLVAYALASLTDRCVVTTEVSATRRQRQNRKLPDVCRTFNANCCDTFTLLRTLNFSTRWRKQ
jgi:hypothetical protein